jgi:Skp family chaperone for outer membrane proteins
MCAAAAWRWCVQDSARVEKERQRASNRVQQLQTELSSMRTQQDSLRKRLQDRLAAQEKDAAAKARELSALRRAGKFDSLPARQSGGELGHARGNLQLSCTLAA